ncbi:hypothetical protein [Rhodoferax saidenbachensis]|uniref:Bulb-type lectin domain-containing protein n=1 Tax=Rhodoferax saidenbachensis TaxID=1484693 RepID=A0ABU1ZTD7_9BURK|nr:hypothetical protein [Rhodoferax saidenbachensis]MDR7308825.1 hypothetical protein [Rhodoferax saidenbachensis]
MSVYYAKRQPIGNVLTTNQTLSGFLALESTNKAYFAMMQPNGNQVCVMGPKGLVWCAGTNDTRAVSGNLAMQDNGNLCVMASTAAVWCSNSHGAAGDYFLILRDSGVLEAYRGKPGNTAAAALVWTSLLDPVYYADRYPDLKKTFGSDARALMGHWIDWGRYEDRSPRTGFSDEGRTKAQSVNLDTMFYANKYSDLKQAFGYDAGKLYEHWMNFGRKEGRMPNRETDELMAQPPRSAHGRSVMRIGDLLTEGQTMRSDNGRYRLDLQPDGQLVIYEGNPSDSNRRWYQSHGNIPKDTQYFMAIQSDGHACTYRGRLANNRGALGCFPGGAGGPMGAYFVALQDDGNLVVYKGNGPADNRGWIWDRITTKPSSGFDFRGAAESVGKFVTNAVGTATGVLVSGANSVAATSVSAANDLAREATTTANAVANGTVNAANVVANGTVGVVNQVANGTVDVSNKVANTTQAVAVNVGNTVVMGGKIVGQEVVKNGEIVGYAVAKLATDAWAYFNNSCGTIGRKVFPIDGYFKGAQRITGAINTYGTSEMKNAANQANQCFEDAQDGFYCSFPKEIAKLVSQSGQIPGNLVNLGTRVFNEAKSEECLIAGAATVTFGAVGLQTCALGKVVVTDAQKAYACFSAAEAKGVMQKFLQPNQASHGFPSKEACTGLGELSFMVAEKIVTDGISAEAKAATKAGKGRTVAVVADELRTIYKIASGAATYDQLTNELSSMPECRD